MNYLAHLFLSLDDPELMLGNFIADDIKLANVDILPVAIQKGVALHRRIDTFTDQQKPWKEAVHLFRTYHNKYAPVVVDIINDHLLATAWGDYSSVRLSDFEYGVYRSFEPMVGDLPPRAKRHVAALLEYKYLKAYESKEGIKNVMSRMDKRTRFPSDFESSVDQLYDNLELFKMHFHELISSLQSELPLMHKQVEQDFDINYPSK